jgi:hypothetical protein
MELANYNDDIADMIRQSEYDMIRNLPQPTMFGGRRPMKHPLPAMNFSPSSLSVGTPPPFSQYYGGAMLYERPMHPYIYGAHPVRGGFSFNDFISGAKDVLAPVAKELAPIAADVGKDLLKDYLTGKGKPRGRPRKHHTPIVPYGGMHFSEMGNGHMTTYGRGSNGIIANRIHDIRLRNQRRTGGYSFQDFIHDAAPVVQTLAPIALMAGLGKPKKRGRKAKALANTLTNATGGYSFNDFIHDAGKVVSPVYNEIIKPVATDVGKDVLKSYLTGKGKARKPRAPKGGFSFKDFTNSIAPVANFVGNDILAPVAKDIGKDALKSLITGKGKPRKASKRGQIVKEVMAKHGLSLPQASKFVKEHGLY